MHSLQPFPEPTALRDWPTNVRDLPQGRYLVRVPVARLLSGQDLHLTVHIVRGGSGPTLGLFAGVHGDETPGVRCVREVLASLSVGALRGTVLAVPVANPLAWQAQQRTTPEQQVDQANLARVFGNPDQSGGWQSPAGSLTRRIAATLERTLFAAMTHLIDYHCYGRDTMVRVALYRTEQEEAARNASASMAHAFGLGVIQGVRGGASTTSACAASLGIPTCVLEMGGSHINRRCEDEIVRLGSEGALRVMRVLGMIETAPPGPDHQLVVDQIVTISPQTSGYYLPEFDLEDLFQPEHLHGIGVRRGQVLGRIFDTYSLACVETVTAPEDGYLVSLFRGGPYQVGGPSLSLAMGRRA